MAELRRRKVAEPQNREPVSADARSNDHAANRPRRSSKESGLLLFATPLIVFLHIALVRSPYIVMFLAVRRDTPVILGLYFCIGGPQRSPHLCNAYRIT